MENLKKPDLMYTITQNHNFHIYQPKPNFFIIFTLFLPTTLIYSIFYEFNLQRKNQRCL